MPYVDYVPTRSGDYWIWESQFCSYAAAHQAELDYTVDEVAALNAADLAANAAKDAMYDARDGYEAAADWVKRVKPPVLEVVCNAPQRAMVNWHPAAGPESDRPGTRTRRTALAERPRTVLRQS